MTTKRLLQGHVEFLRRQFTNATALLALMEKTTKPEELAKMRMEQLDPLKKRIAEFEEAIGELGDGGT
jgi:hypothetical protein